MYWTQPEWTALNHPLYWLNFLDVNLHVFFPLSPTSSNICREVLADCTSAMYCVFHSEIISYSNDSVVCAWEIWQLAPCLNFCRGSKVTDESATGVASTCQQLSHRRRRNHGNAAWTCQPVEDTQFLHFHYSAMDMRSSRQPKQQHISESDTEWCWNWCSRAESKYFPLLFLTRGIYLLPVLLLSDSQFWKQGIGFHS